MSVISLALVLPARARLWSCPPPAKEEGHTGRATGPRKPVCARRPIPPAHAARRRRHALKPRRAPSRARLSALFAPPEFARAPPPPPPPPRLGVGGDCMHHLIHLWRPGRSSSRAAADAGRRPRTAGTAPRSALLALRPPGRLALRFSLGHRNLSPSRSRPERVKAQAPARVARARSPARDLATQACQCPVMA